MSRLLALFSADSSFTINACKQQNEDLKREKRYSGSGKSTSRALVIHYRQMGVCSWEQNNLDRSLHPRFQSFLFVCLFLTGRLNIQPNNIVNRGWGRANFFSFQSRQFWRKVRNVDEGKVLTTFVVGWSLEYFTVVLFFYIVQRLF